MGARERDNREFEDLVSLNKWCIIILFAPFCIYQCSLAFKQIKTSSQRKENMQTIDGSI